MADSKWNGGAGDYLDPAQWTPAAVPLYDADTTATIDAGTVTLGNAEPNNITLVLGGPSSATLRGPVLVLDDAALGPEMTLDLTLANATLDVEGYDTNFGVIVVGSPQPGGGSVTVATVESRGLGQLNQYGTIRVGYDANLNIAPRDFAGSTVLNNEGLIELAGGDALATGRISGHGTVELASIRSTMYLGAGVDAGQTFALRQGTLSIDQFSSFQGTISGFSSSAARVELSGVRCDAATYVHDAFGERLVLTNNGRLVGTLQLADTPDTQYAVTPEGVGSTMIRPSEVYADGSIPGSIAADTVTIRNAEPNGQVVALGGPGFDGLGGGPNLILDNAALGPDLLVTVASPDAVGEQSGIITVQGFDTNYGEIDVIPSAGVQTSSFGNSLTIDIQAGSQLNQEGTIRVISPGSLSLIVNGPGTFNNDGQLFVGQGSSAILGPVIGSGTITVDGGRLLLNGATSAQTIDLLGGTVTTSSFGFNPTIKDWNSAGQVILSSTSVDSVQFNQTSDAGGDLALFSGTRQVADLRLLGAYATSDFTVSSGNAGSRIAINDRIPPAG